MIAASSWNCGDSAGVSDSIEVEAALIDVKRRLEFVRDCVEQRGFELFALARRVGPVGRFLHADPFERDRDQIQQRLKRAVGQRRAFQRQAPDRLPAQQDRRDEQTAAAAKLFPCTATCLSFAFDVEHVVRAAAKYFRRFRVVERDARAFEDLRNVPRGLRSPPIARDR